MFHRDGYVADCVDVAACDIADAGVDVVEAVSVTAVTTAVVGRVDVDADT